MASIAVTQSWVITAANAAEWTQLLAWWAVRSLRPDMIGATVQQVNNQRKLTITKSHNESNSNWDSSTIP